MCIPASSDGKVPGDHSIDNDSEMPNYQQLKHVVFVADM